MQEYGTMKKDVHLSNLTDASAETAVSVGFNKYGDYPAELDWNIDYLTSAHVKEVEKCNGYDVGQAEMHYDHLAAVWEDIYSRIGYPDPTKVADMVAKHARARGINKETCKILDLGCGTGMIGARLADLGFKNVTGYDVSSGMLAMAEKKDAYKKLDKFDLHKIDYLDHRMKNSCDFVVCSGLINNNHMDYKLFELMILCAKKGAMIIFAAKWSYIGEYWYSQITDMLQEEQRLKFIDEDKFFKYDKILASIGRFSKTPSRVQAFEVTQDEKISYILRDESKLEKEI